MGGESCRQKKSEGGKDGEKDESEHERTLEGGTKRCDTVTHPCIGFYCILLAGAPDEKVLTEWDVSMHIQNLYIYLDLLRVSKPQRTKALVRLDVR